ncbi:MAG TPA: cupin domain-containing protein [Pirellulales bacterium]|jgi:quercetin dioxygenase-like cupin family protein|nr:cupin domain-containing protein [Pirellulales bacterium]
MSYFVQRAETAQHTIFPGVEVFTMHGAHLMLSYVEIQPGGVVEEHSHPHEQLGLLLEGELDFTIGGERRIVRKGDMWRIPGGVLHSAVGGPQGCHALDVFYPIREEYT